MKVISAQRFAKKKFRVLPFEGVWRDSFGEVEIGSRWLIYGDSGHGKTEFACQIAKYVGQWGKVIYASAEQGESSSMQKPWTRNKMQERRKVELVSDFNFEELVEKITKTKRLKMVVVDSIDYLNMSKEQYVELDKVAKNVMLLFIAWADGKQPKSRAAKDIQYMTSVKIRIVDFVAFGRSRYGGNIPYVIYEEKAKEKHAFLNRK